MDRPDGQAATDFERAVAAVLAATLPGDVVTYAEVAVEAGYSARAGRAVGSFLARHGAGHPWWRVVTASGRLVPGHEEEHARRLRAEGVEVVSGGVARMVRRRAGGAWPRHTGARPGPSRGDRPCPSTTIR